MSINQNKKAKIKIISKNLAFGEPKLNIKLPSVPKKTIQLRFEKRSREINVLYRVYSHTKMLMRIGEVFREIAKDITHAFVAPSDIQVQIIYDGKTYASSRSHSPFLFIQEEKIIIAGIKRGILRVGYIKHPGHLKHLAFSSGESKLIKNIAKILIKHLTSREKIERHRAIISKASIGIFIAKEGQIVDTNAFFSRMLGYKEKQCIGHTLKHLFVTPIKQHNNLGGKRQEAKMLAKDKKIIDVALRLQRIDYNGQRALLGWINNITPLKEAERQLNAFNDELKQAVEEKTHHLKEANKRLESLNQLKDDFIATTSHELRSPLTAIRGYLSLMVEKESLKSVPEHLQNHLLQAYKNADILNHLVRNILDVSRLEAGRFDLNIRKFDLIKVIKKVIDSFSFQLNQNKLKVDLKIPKNDSTIMIYLDPLRMSQVFRNLMDNAVKFSKRGKTVSIKITKKKKTVQVLFIDEGTGIPKTKINSIFHRFTQLKTSKTKPHGGAGLGMFIVKQIIDLHRGSIDVKSERNKGTTFKIELPLSLT